MRLDLTQQLPPSPSSVSQAKLRVDAIVLVKFTLVLSSFILYTVLPEIQSNFDETVVDEGDSLAVNCNATGNPAPTLTWLHNGAPVMNPMLGTPSMQTLNLPNDTGLTYVVSLLLNITEVEEDNSGTYVCQAINDAGTDTASFNLTVQCELKIFIQNQKLIII